MAADAPGPGPGANAHVEAGNPRGPPVQGVQGSRPPRPRHRPKVVEGARGLPCGEGDFRWVSNPANFLGPCPPFLLSHAAHRPSGHGDRHPSNPRSLWPPPATFPAGTTSLTWRQPSSLLSPLCYAPPTPSSGLPPHGMASLPPCPAGAGRGDWERRETHTAGQAQGLAPYTTTGPKSHLHAAPVPAPYRDMPLLLGSHPPAGQPTGRPPLPLRPAGAGWAGG